MRVFVGLYRWETHRKFSRSNHKVSPFMRHLCQPSRQALIKASKTVRLPHGAWPLNCDGKLDHFIWLEMISCRFDQFGSQAFCHFSPMVWFKLVFLITRTWGGNAESRYQVSHKCVINHVSINWREGYGFRPSQKAVDDNQMMSIIPKGGEVSHCQSGPSKKVRGGGGTEKRGWTRKAVNLWVLLMSQDLAHPRRPLFMPGQTKCFAVAFFVTLIPLVWNCMNRFEYTFPEMQGTLRQTAQVIGRTTAHEGTSDTMSAPEFSGWYEILRLLLSLLLEHCNLGRKTTIHPQLQCVTKLLQPRLLTLHVVNVSCEFWNKVLIYKPCQTM